MELGLRLCIILANRGDSVRGSAHSAPGIMVVLVAMSITPGLDKGPLTQSAG